MRRDMDLVRKILMAAEDSPSGYAPDPLKIEGYSKEEIQYHALIIIEAGLATGGETTPFNGPPAAIIHRLTWRGHEFLEAAREESRWKEAKRIIGEKAGSVSIQVWTAVLQQLTMKAVGL